MWIVVFTFSLSVPQLPIPATVAATLLGGKSASLITDERSKNHTLRKVQEVEKVRVRDL